MSRRNGRISGDWNDVAEDSCPSRGRGPGSGGRTGASALTGGGLTLAALVLVGLVMLAREPGGGSADGSSRVRFQRTLSPLGSVAFAPDGRALALGRSDGGLMIQHLSGGRPVEIEAGPGLGVLPRGLAYSPDGKTLASGGLGTVVKLWDMASGSLHALLEGHFAPVAALAFSPDGTTLASGSLDGDVKLWDVATGRELTELAGHSQDVRGLAFSPDGKTLVSGSLDGDVKLWNVADGRELARFNDRHRRVYGLAFSPDGKTMALGLGSLIGGVAGEVIVWKLAGGPLAFRVIGPASFAAVAFSPDGKTLAAGGGDRVVKLWDVETGRELASLAGHEGFIASLAFSPDGETLATVGQDALVGLFDVGHASLTPVGHRL